MEKIKKKVKKFMKWKYIYMIDIYLKKIQEKNEGILKVETRLFLIMLLSNLIIFVRRFLFKWWQIIFKS